METLPLYDKMQVVYRSQDLQYVFTQKDLKCEEKEMNHKLWRQNASCVSIARFTGSVPRTRKVTIELPKSDPTHQPNPTQN